MRVPPHFPLFFLSFLCLSSLLPLVSCYVEVHQPSPVSGKYVSAFVNFGEDQRLLLPPANGTLIFVQPLEGCTIPTFEPSPTPLLALAWDDSVYEECETLTAFCVALQSSNSTFSGLILGVTSFYGHKPFGYTAMDDPEQIKILVSFVVTEDFALLNSTLGSEATLDTDLGPFYALAFSIPFYLFRAFYPITYLLIFFYAMFLFVIDVRAKGIDRRSSLQIQLCVALLCLGRAIRIALEEHKGFYSDHLPSHGENIFSSVIFWCPIAIGTYAYTLTSFNWANIASTLEGNRFIAFIRKPLLIFFFCLIPLTIILPVFGEFFNFSVLFIFPALIMVMGLFETFAFLYFGVKVLWYLSNSSKALNRKRSGLERKLTIFVVMSVVAWFFVIMLSVIFVILFLIITKDPLPLFIVQIFRDLVIVFLAAILLGVLQRSTISQSSSSKPQSSSGKAKDDVSLPSFDKRKEES